MLQLSHQPYPIPQTTSSFTLRTHPLSPQLTTAILTSPYSRYSKLASLVSQAQSLLPPTTTTPSTSNTPITISLPPLNPFAVTYLLDFLSGNPTSDELGVRKGDVRRAFEVLGVDYPPGFDQYAGMGDGVEIGEMGKRYVRRVEDYSTREVYEARMKMEMEDGSFGVSVGSGIGRDAFGTGGNDIENVSFREATSTTSSSAALLPGNYVDPVPPMYTPPNSTQFLPSPSLKTNVPAPTTFHETLHSSLLTKLSTLLLSHIHPALTTQATLGIFRGIFILLCDPAWSSIPLSNVVTSSPHQKIGDGSGYKEVINLPSGDGQGGEFSMGFLAQEVVVAGLRKIIGSELGVVEPPPQPPPPPREPTPPPQKKGWFGLGKKKVKKVEVEEVVPVVEELQEGTKVDVRMEDVWVRWEGGDGLVKTRGGKGIVVWVEVLGSE
ncbi:hypothetical protein EV426DRAFT_319452 [Tirmania nivea]|nr:hypothetical protein EV426DRAFT_319452 [Tirmania nivea]